MDLACLPAIPLSGNGAESVRADLRELRLAQSACPSMQGFPVGTGLRAQPPCMARWVGAVMER
jgi:hypothetical protein